MLLIRDWTFHLSIHDIIYLITFLILWVFKKFKGYSWKFKQNVFDIYQNMLTINNFYIGIDIFQREKKLTTNYITASTNCISTLMELDYMGNKWNSLHAKDFIILESDFETHVCLCFFRFKRRETQLWRNQVKFAEYIIVEQETYKIPFFKLFFKQNRYRFFCYVTPWYIRRVQKLW